MRTYILTIILAVALLACRRPAPPGQHWEKQNLVVGHEVEQLDVLVDDRVDAGSVEGGSPSTPAPPLIDDGAVTRMARLGPMRHAVRPDAGAAPRMAAHKPPDERVMACTRQATDKASLMQCLGALKGLLPAPELPDAGPKAATFGATRPPPINPVWAVPTWHVNPSTGSDANACTTSGSPCKTANELYGRFETWDTFNPVATTINVDVDDVATDPINWAPTVMNGGAAYILGAETGLCTGNLGTVTPKTYAAGTADGRLHADLGACAAGNQGMLIEDTTRSNHTAFIDSCSGTVCALTQPTLPNVPVYTTFPTTAEDDGWVAGNAFAVLRPTKAYAAGFRPKEFGNSVLAGTADAAIAHIWIPNQKTLPDCSQVILSHAASFIESRVDAYVQYDDTTVGNEGNFLNSWGSCGGQFKEATVRFGALNTLNSANTSTAITGIASYDVIVHGGLQVGPSSNVPILGPIYLDDQIDVFGGADLFGDQAVNGILYGTYTIFGGSIGASTLFYTPLAVTAFGGVPTFNFCQTGVTNANAYDTTSPSQYYRGRTITPANLDAVVGGASGTGFGGTAYCDSGSTISGTGQVTTAGATYLNAGSGITLTPNSPGTGQLTIASTGASCPVNLATCVTGVLGVPNGGTGDTTLAAHAVLVGEGTSAIATVGPGANNLPLIGKGASADPAFQILPIPGGGWGADMTTCSNTAGDIMIGSGGAAFGCISPGSTNQYLMISGGIPVWAGPFTSAFTTTSGVSVPSTTTITQVGATTITAPTGGAKANITIGFSLTETCGPCGTQNDVTYGLGIDSNASFVDSHAISFPAAVPSTAPPTVAPPEVWGTTLTAGSHTVYGLTLSSTVAFTAAANSHVVLTP